MRLTAEVPEGGCRKVTCGEVHQVFDKDGNLVVQEFIAGDECDYEKADGAVIEPDDPRYNFYHPFNMTQPGERWD